MLDPTRYALTAETVGFRKRMGQSVDWASFNEALQTQTDSIKVRREIEETPISELHVMGAQRFGIEGNAKTNEIARQERQMNGYVLRSFLATGGPVILPPKKNDSLLGIPSKFGHIQYTQNAVQGQQYTSAFTEPLNAPLENNTILLGRTGVEALSESISNPYKALQFQLNLNASRDQIDQVAQEHEQIRSERAQEDFARQEQILSAPKNIRPLIAAAEQVERTRREQSQPEPEETEEQAPRKRAPIGEGTMPKNKKPKGEAKPRSPYPTRSKTVPTTRRAFTVPKPVRRIDDDEWQRTLDLGSDPLERGEEQALDWADNYEIPVEIIRSLTRLHEERGIPPLIEKEIAEIASRLKDQQYEERMADVAAVHADDPNQYSSITLGSNVERIIAMNTNSDPVPLPGTARGIAYNDNGIPNSLPSAGFASAAIPQLDGPGLQSINLLQQMLKNPTTTPKKAKSNDPQTIFSPELAAALERAKQRAINPPQRKTTRSTSARQTREI